MTENVRCFLQHFSIFIYVQFQPLKRGNGSKIYGQLSFESMNASMIGFNKNVEGSCEQIKVQE